MEPKHTPVPWSIGERPVEISGSFFEVVGSNGIPTSFLQERIDEDLSDRSAIKNHKEDAAFIVRAVNEYDADKNTIKELISCLKAALEERDCNSDESDRWENVIAQAEGK